MKQCPSCKKTTVSKLSLCLSAVGLEYFSKCPECSCNYTVNGVWKNSFLLIAILSFLASIALTVFYQSYLPYIISFIVVFLFFIGVATVSKPIIKLTNLKHSALNFIVFTVLMAGFIFITKQLQ